jgi:uncharacterized protein (TIGR03083 family)
MDHREYCDALEIEINRFAEVLETASLDAAVPGCPDWSVRDLALHLGTVHRWAENLVANVAPHYRSPTSMGFTSEPVSRTWICEGGAQLLATLRAGDPNEPMWAWGADQHLGWWSRRQLHETLVHRMDLEAACGASSDVPTEIAADAIDEFLVNLKCAEAFSPQVRELRGAGEVLQIHATDANESWSIRFIAEGFEVTEDVIPGEAAFSGPAVALLLVLYRRLTLAATGVTVTGRQELADFWLAHSALE